MRVLLLSLLVLLAGLTLICAESNELPLLVQTTQGRINGGSTGNFHYFKSVPYAQPPVGALRFMAPRPPLNDDVNVYDAASWNQKACPQGGFDYASEDCLYLDIFTPTNPSKNPDGYPVHVFIHGGSFVIGSKEEFVSNSDLATKGIISVTINYRLNLLAYLQVEGDQPAVNGFLDQVMALKWVNANIAAFGGNPNLVTIHGQSAGASSVMLHITSPASKGLFHRAVSESSMGQARFPEAKEVKKVAKLGSELFGCAMYDKQCLQAAPIETVASAVSTYIHSCFANTLEGFQYDMDRSYLTCALAPQVGTKVLPYQMYDAFSRGKINRVPMIFGTAWVEGLADYTSAYQPFTPVVPALYGADKLKQTEGVYKQFINEFVDRRSYADNPEAKKKLLSKRAQKLYNAYPYKLDKELYFDGYNGLEETSALDASYVYFALYTDLWYLCSGRSLIRALYKKLKNNAPPVYMYRFKQAPQKFKGIYRQNYHSNATEAVTDGFFSLNLYPSHGSDLPYFLSHQDEAAHFPDRELRLQERMTAALLNFVQTGDPNKGGFRDHVGRSWPRYQTGTEPTIYLTEPDRGGNIAYRVRDQQCKFWDENGYYFAPWK